MKYKLFALDMVEAYEGHYRDLEKRMIQKGLEEARKNAGILGHTIPENYDKRLESILDSSFHNAKWSERLWHDQDALKMALDKELTRGIMLGEHPRDIAKRMAGQFDVSRAALFRLAVTKMTRLQIAVQEDSYKRAGIDWYEYIATIDDRTSKICTQLHMKHFPVGQMKSGLNAPPMQPHCRSSTAPYVPTEKEEAALRKAFGMMDQPRDEKGSGGLSTGGEDGRISLDKETSSRRVGRLKDPARDRALKVLAAHEKRIVDSPVEVAVVVFPDGEVYEYTGMKSRVYPPTGEVMKGAYVTHNHPKDSTHEWSFSNGI
jgi:SPP1 gp7 family putative phage head morphogenesis protein